MNPFTITPFPKHSQKLEGLTFQKSLESLKATAQGTKGVFLNIIDNDSVINQCRSVLSSFEKKKILVHIGIGGSSLGAQTLANSFAHVHDTKKSCIFLTSPHPEIILKALDEISFDEALFHVVSKSGKTLEPLVILDIIHQKHKHLKDNLIISTTQNDNNSLCQFAKSNSIPVLNIPENLSGRYSIFSSAGIIPALFLNINVNNIYEGARLIKPYLLNENNEQNLVINFSLSIIELYNQGIKNFVLANYIPQLKTFGDWFVQLWAESLGKDSKEINPLYAQGPDFQHSTLQLFKQGERNKMFLFLNTKHPLEDTVIQGSSKISIIQQLKGKSLYNVSQALCWGTIESLKVDKFPTSFIETKKCDESFLGAICLFFQTLTVVTAQALNINPFDQPGVEEGKVLTKKRLID